MSATDADAERLAEDEPRERHEDEPRERHEDEPRERHEDEPRGRQDDEPRGPQDDHRDADLAALPAELSQELAALRPAGRNIADQHRFARLHDSLFGTSRAPVRWGRFVLLDRLGEGGMGVVYSAYDPRLDRKVALKLLRPDDGAAAGARERLRREAQALARLSHPNVIPVHDVLVVDGQVAVVMEFVAGQTVRQWLDGATRSWHQVLAVYLAAARGLAAAHQAGIVHRDFKPDNVLIGEDERVRVADFGLARTMHRDTAGNPAPSGRSGPAWPADAIQVTASQASVEAGFALAHPLTATGAFLGTPAYAAPERMDTGALDTSGIAEAGDQFGLCVALYEGLYGMRPFAGETWSELRGHMLAGTIAPRPADSDVPEWLHAVVMRGVAPDPARRWPSIDALIKALEADPSARRARWLRRLALVAALLGVLAVAAWAIVQAEQAAATERVLEQAAQAERARAHAALEEQIRSLRDSVRMLVVDTLAGEPTQALAILRDVEDPASTPRWYERAAAAVRTSVARQILEGHGHAITAMAVSPDNRFIVTASRDRTARIWPLDGQSSARVLSGHDERLTALAIRPDGQIIATGSKDATVRLWRADGSGPAIALSGHDGSIEALAFAPDGKILASASTDHTVRLWTPASQTARVLAGHTDEVRSVRFSPDGAWLATASADHTGRLFAVHDPDRAPLVLIGHTDVVHDAQFSPDSTRVLTVSNDRTARLFRVADGRLVAILAGHDGYVVRGVFSPDGRRIATGAYDGTVRIWPGDGSGPARVLDGDTSGIYALAFSPDSQRVAAGAINGDVRVWQVAGDRPAIVLRGHGAVIQDIAFTGDGRSLISAGWDYKVRIWRVPEHPSEVVLAGHGGGIVAGAFSPNGSHLVTASLDRTARVWSLDGPLSPVVLRGHTGPVTSVDISRDGARVVTGSFDRTARVWRLDGRGQPLVLGGHDNIVQAVAFSPDGTRVATGSRDTLVRILSADGTGTPVVLGGHGDRVFHVEWSRDGAYLLTVADDHSARVWNTSSGASSILDDEPRGLNAARFSPDGTRVALALGDGRVRIAPVGGEGSAVDIAAHASPVEDVHFNHDGTQLVSCSADGSARVWGVDGSGPVAVFAGHRGAVLGCVFDPDGARVLTFAEDDLMRVWPVAGHDPPAVLEGHGGRITLAAFDRTGTRVISVAMDSSVRLWNQVAPVASLEQALWQATDYCMPVATQQAILGFPVDILQRVHRDCEARVSRRASTP